MALAAGSATPVQLREPAASYHKVNLTEASGLNPVLLAGSHFAKTEAPAFTAFNVAHPDFFKAFAASLAKTPSPTGRPTCAGTSSTPTRPT